MLLKRTSVLATVFVLVFFSTRIPRLQNDEINPDAVNWHYRSEQFVVGLKHNLLEKTYQHYHPGVTLMWITGIPIELYKQITGINVYTHENFLTFHFVAKLSLVVVQAVLSVLVLFYLAKIIGFAKAFLTIFIFSMEPFVLGNSRLFHMDLIFTLFTFLGLITSFLYIDTRKIIYTVLTGAFISLAFLTRSIGIGQLLFVLGFGGLALLIQIKNFKSVWQYISLVLIVFIGFTFLLFPALWKNPVYVMSDIFSEAQRIGLEDGHNQIFFGKKTQNPGILFYPIVLLLKISPFVLIGLAGYLFKIINILRKKEENNIKLVGATKKIGFVTFLLVYYLGYFSVMIYSSKKLDRYMLTVFPLLAYLSGYGYYYMYGFFTRARKLKFYIALSTLTFIVFVVVPLVKVFPYYFVYTSPLFGSAQNANKIVGQKPFGMGIPDLLNFIDTRYGPDVNLGFIDTKPMRAIYPNSKVFDIRVDGASNYDLLILGINEEIPDDILDSAYTFNKTYSYYINGLEYWRVYEKASK